MERSFFSILGPVLFILVFVLCEIFCHAPSENSSTLVVDSPFGKIKGSKKSHDQTGKSYYSFKGIPYAKPPVGELRFAKPQPHAKIDGIFDATSEKPIVCPQDGILSTQVSGISEDCLVLNIQTPITVNQKKDMKKVLLFIHGGSFSGGSAYIYDAASFVVTQDVIVVAMNYRLGILGFLSTENEASPGNFGLWDQTLALKWVKENIRAFGGDPDDVTVSGESAGGISVGFHMISRQSKGLFTKAWTASGSTSSAFYLDSKATFHALEAAKYAGCWYKNTDYKLNADESRKIINCLRNRPFSTFISFLASVGEKYEYVPVIDGDFILDFPKKLLKNDGYLDSIGFFKRSYLSGTLNFDAGIYDIHFQGVKASIFSNKKFSPEEKENMWQEYLNITRESILETIAGGDKSTSDAIKDFYNRRIADNYKALVEIAGDALFLIPAIDIVVAASRRSSCSSYLLYFDHFPEYMKGTRARGLFHGFDLVYLFDLGLNELNMLFNLGISGNLAEFKEEMELKQLYSSVIGDFVRTGDPGRRLNLRCGWPKYDEENGNYLRFNLRPWVTNFLEKDKQDFWFHTLPNLKKVKQSEHLEF